jgi:hypothetical protein
MHAHRGDQPTSLALSRRGMSARLAENDISANAVILTGGPASHIRGPCRGGRVRQRRWTVMQPVREMYSSPVCWPGTRTTNQVHGEVRSDFPSVLFSIVIVHSDFFGLLTCFMFLVNRLSVYYKLDNWSRGNAQAYFLSEIILFCFLHATVVPTRIFFVSLKCIFFSPDATHGHMC